LQWRNQTSEAGAGAERAKVCCQKIFLACTRQNAGKCVLSEFSAIMAHAMTKAFSRFPSEIGRNFLPTFVSKKQEMRVLFDLRQPIAEWAE
jgi:hypothetical protein